MSVCLTIGLFQHASDWRRSNGRISCHQCLNISSTVWSGNDVNTRFRWKLFHASLSSSPYNKLHPQHYIIVPWIWMGFHLFLFFYCSVPASLASPPIFWRMEISQCNALICIAYPWSLDDSLLGFVQMMLTMFWRARRKENDFCWFCVMIYFLLVSWGESLNIENDIRRNYAIFICLILLEGYERYKKYKATG